jgi:hypothetical protein
MSSGDKGKWTRSELSEGLYYIGDKERRKQSVKMVRLHRIEERRLLKIKTKKRETCLMTRKHIKPVMKDRGF